MVERCHRSLKAAIHCHEKKGWAECLSSVLLGFRSVFREDLGSTVAKLVYVSSINLPGELINTKSNPFAQNTTLLKNSLNKFTILDPYKHKTW